MLKLIHNKKGFTLIELMIVVAIIGILAAIAIPNFLRFQAKSKQAEAKTNLGAIGTTAESWMVENDSYQITVITDLGWAPTGTPRYSYWYAIGAPGGTPTAFPGGANTDVLSCARSTAPASVTVAIASGPPAQFTAGAKGQIDTDAACDEWSYNNSRVLTNPLNDVGT